MSSIPEHIRKQYEIPDFQKVYEGLIQRVDSQPLPKAAFEKILSLHQESPFKASPAIIDEESQRAIAGLEEKLKVLRRLAGEGKIDPWTAYTMEWTEQGRAFYACRIDEKLAKPAEVIKSYIAYGRLNASFGRRLGGSTQTVGRRQRFKGWPRLQALANAFMIVSDVSTDDDWTKLSVYAKEKFSELNPKEKKYDSISKRA